ncbi:MAG: hypothetical protein IT428_16615 [Planctomycetaceae bacterium]|nr:hypothetical protein [Planctomycetaceae bacterium]
MAHVDRVLPALRSAVERDPCGYLECGLRNFLWDAMIEEDRESGRFRWLALGCLTAAGTLQKWNAREDIPEEFRGIPGTCLHVAAAFLTGRCSREVAVEVHDEQQVPAESDVYHWYQTYLPDIPKSPDWFPFAACAAHAALRETIYRKAGRIGNYGEKDFEGQESQDPNLLAYMDVGGEKSGETEIAELSRKWWLNWLDVQVPIVLEPLSRIRQMLDKHCR